MTSGLEYVVRRCQQPRRAKKAGLPMMRQLDEDYCRQRVLLGFIYKYRRVSGLSAMCSDPRTPCMFAKTVEVVVKE